MTSRLVVLLLLALLSECVVAQGSLSGSDMIAEDYAKAGALVALADGRHLNLRCQGTGTPVVLLEAGANAESSTWHRVQAPIARLTRVCTYDRAGYGFSDEGPLPRDLAASVADLHALIQAADFPTPLLLVGHSLGSNIVRRYSQIHPAMVLAMVLVDPPEQGADQAMPKAWQSQLSEQLKQREEILQLCEAAAVAGDQAALKERCVRAPPAWMGSAVAAAMTENKAKPSYWRTLRSELGNNVALFAAPVPADESYGAIPLLLLRPETQDEDAPPEIRAVLEAARSQTHERILAASQRSRLIKVANTTHDIQLDQPSAIVAAVKELLAAKPTQGD